MMPREPKRAFKFGDVVSVRYHGDRPAVVISAESHNATSLDVVVMTITTQTQHAMRGAAIVLNNWKDFGLREPSIVKPVVSSVDVQDTELIGHVDDAVKNQLRQSMATIFGGKVTKK
jgi:mRNA-degrading endonuclease toxin of MazEF toxin-antitoxin module